MVRILQESIKIGKIFYKRAGSLPSAPPRLSGTPMVKGEEAEIITKGGTL